MELFTSDRRIINSDDFPEQITPFPETTSFLFGHPTTVITSPEIKHRPNFHPQKLRPIRCNEKSFLEYSDRTENTQPVQLLGNGCFSRNIMSVSATEVGFLSHQPSELGGQAEECFDTPANGAVADSPEKCNSVSGNGFRLPETVAAMPEISSEFATAFENTNTVGRVSDTETSSSSDYDGNTSEDIHGNQTRKRKTKKKLELFIENLVAKVMQKQEQMHNQLIEMIEMKEKERILREEAWKQQEVERAKREKEIRAQETSRCLAIVSFIQNVLGSGIQIPKPFHTLCPEEDEGEVHYQGDVKFDKTDERWDNSEVHSNGDGNGRRLPETEVKTTPDLSNKRWPKSEVEALVTLRTALDYKFRSMGSKGSIWEEVSIGLSNMGYDRSAKKCKQKWENMNKYFRRATGSGKMRPENAKTCPYFQELKILYKNEVNNPANKLNNIYDENEDKTAGA